MKLTSLYQPSSRFAQVTILTISVGVLQGCSSLADDTNYFVEIQPVTTEEQLSQHLAEWEAYKPKIDEIIDAKEAADIEATKAAPKVIVNPIVSKTVIPPIAVVSDSTDMMDTSAEKMASSEEAEMVSKSEKTTASDDVTADIAAPQDSKTPKTIPAEKMPSLPKRPGEYVIAEMPVVSNIDEADAMMTNLEYKLDDDVIVDARNTKTTEKDGNIDQKAEGMDKTIISADSMNVKDPTIDEEETADRYVRAEFKGDKPKPMVNKANAAIATKPAMKKAKVGEYGLQLVSHVKAGETEKSWAKISRKFRTLLSGKEAIVEKAMVKNKQYYRLKVGPYRDKKIAVDTCKQLVLSHQDCIVSNYYGEPIE